MYNGIHEVKKGRTLIQKSFQSITRAKEVRPAATRAKSADPKITRFEEPSEESCLLFSFGFCQFCPFKEKKRKDKLVAGAGAESMATDAVGRVSQLYTLHSVRANTHYSVHTNMQAPHLFLLS